MAGPPSTRSSQSEKGRAQQIEAVDEKRQVPVFGEDVDVSGVDERKLMRKVDLVQV